MGFREKLREIIFGVETRAGRAFDVGLLVCILVSVLVAMLETVPSIAAEHGAWLRAAGWGFTGLFTAEYLIRLWCADRARRYALSFFGIVDFLAVFPAYAALFSPLRQLVMVVRALRLLRIFRIFGMGQYVEETRVLLGALRASARRIVVFLLFVLTTVTVLGSLMYAVERGNGGFDSIPRGIYWAIVTLTTVGYGDIRPQTGLGQAVAAVIMILGYSMIVVPTGFVSVAVASASKAGGHAAGPEEPERGAGPVCPGCGASGHGADARFCRRCGRGLPG